MLFLAGDIGGTKALLQLIYTMPEPEADLAASAPSHTSSSAPTANQTIQLAKQSYPCANFDSLESILNSFLSQALSADNLSALNLADIVALTSGDGFLEIQSACFGLPGPVNGRLVQLTNLPWVVDAQKIEQACSIEKVHFVNDFYAAASGIETLTVDESIPLYRPQEQTSGAGNRLVIGAGTGLGVAPIFYDGSHYAPVSSEGGHFDFAPISETQQLLQSWLWQQWPHISYERVLSGPGLETLYLFFKTFECPTTYSSIVAVKGSGVSADLKKNTFKNTQNIHSGVIFADSIGSPLVSLGNKGLTAAQVTEAAEQGDPNAIKALIEFVTIYGAFVGAVALIWHAPQGIYLAGGIAAKIQTWMEKPYFKAAFLEKGRMSKVVATMPVFLVTDESLGLKGAMQQNRMLEKHR